MGRFSVFVLALLVCVTAGVSAAAQNVVRGSVKDAAKGEPIPYATVAALCDTVIVKAVAANDKGLFELALPESGEYRVEVSAVGYSTVTKGVKADGKPLDMGEIALNEGVAVDAVVLSVQRPIVTNDAEKLSYSVEDDPEAQTSTLEEVIRKVPQLSIDAEGKVLMNGQSDYKILVNGHASGSMSRNFSDVIKSMPASSIKKIEVITNPSMKYDAEGAGGVLNIITTKARFDGYNGSVRVGGNSELNANWRANGSANFTVQTDKLALSAMLYHTWADSDNLFSRYSEGSIKNLGDAPFDEMRLTQFDGSRFNSTFGSIEASYQIDSLNLITAEVGMYGGGSYHPGKSNTVYLDALGDTISHYKSDIRNRYKWMGINAGINYQHTFGKENHTLTVSDNVDITPPELDLEQQSITGIVGMTDRTFKEQSRNRAFENVLQIDYNNPITKRHNVEVGLKHSFNNSVISYVTESNGLERHGSSRLDRHILALYAGYAYSVERLSLRAGARAEQAWYALATEEEGERQMYSPRLFDVIPYASVTYTPKVGHSLSLAYTQRLNRPSVYSMSPYVQEDVNTKTYGNPDLRSGLKHTLTLKYNFHNNKWSASVGGNVNLTDNGVQNYEFLDSEGYMNNTYVNDAHSRFYIGELSASFRPSSKLNISVSARGGWGEHWLPQQEGSRMYVSGWCVNQSANIAVALWKGARLTLSEHLMVLEPRFQIRSESPVVFTSVLLNQKFLKEKLEVSVQLQNPHGKYMRFEGEKLTPTSMTIAVNRTVARSLGIAVSYRFGKQGLRVKSTNRNEDNSSSDVGGGSKGGGAGAGI